MSLLISQVCDSKYHKLFTPETLKGKETKHILWYCRQICVHCTLYTQPAIGNWLRPMGENVFGELVHDYSLGFFRKFTLRICQKIIEMILCWLNVKSTWIWICDEELCFFRKKFWFKMSKAHPPELKKFMDKKIHLR